MKLKEFLKIENLIKLLLQAAIFVPIIHTSFTLYPSHYGKTVVFQILTSAAFLLYLILAVRGRAEKPKLTAVFWALLGYLSIRIITGFLGVNPEKSFWGNESRMGGNFTWIHFFIFFYLLTQFFKEKKEWLKLFKISLFASFVVSISAVMEWRGISPFGWWAASGNTRVSGLLGNPIPFAGYVLFSIFLGLFTIAECAPKMVKKNILTLAGIGFITGLNVLTMFWSQTRGAIYSFYCAFPAFFALACLLSKKKIFKLITILAVVLSIATLVVLSFGGGNGFLMKVAETETAKTRLLNWQISLRGWLNNAETFLLGYGTENYDTVFDKFYNPEFIKYSFYETVGDKPHNILFEVAVGSGIFGLIAYLSLFAVALLAVFKMYKKEKISKSGAIFLALSFLTYLSQNLFGLDSTNVLLLFFLTLAFMSETGGESEGEKIKLSKLAVFPIVVLIVVLSWFGTIKPLKASYYISKAITSETSNNKTAVNVKENWSGFAQKALESESVFEDEIRTHIANNVFKYDAVGQFNPATDMGVLVVLLEKLKESAEKHNGAYAYKHRLAQAQSMMGQYADKKYFDDSERTFKELDAENPDRQAVGLAWAQMRLLGGDADGAVDILEKLTQKNPDSDEVVWYYGLALSAFGDEERGLAEMEKSLSLGQYALSFNSNVEFLASLWEKRKEYDKIIDTREMQIKTAKSEKWPSVKIAVLFTRLAATYAKAGQTEEAIRAVEEAVNYDPSLEGGAIEFINLLKK